MMMLRLGGVVGEVNEIDAEEMPGLNAGWSVLGLKEMGSLLSGAGDVRCGRLMEMRSMAFGGIAELVVEFL